MNDKIIIVLIISVSIIIIIILYTFNRNKEKFQKDSKKLQDCTHKITENEDLIEESDNIEMNVLSICDDIFNINKDSIYAGVYILDNIITKKYCLRIIYEAERYAKVHGGWRNDRHKRYPTYDINIRNIYPIDNFICNVTHSSIIPQIAEKFNLEQEYLGISELFIVKYCKEGQTKLLEHADGSEFSFIIPLNKDYVGGGTKFKFLEDIIDPDIGNCTIFCGHHRHKGIEIKSGERYILTGFLNYGWHRRRR